MAGNATKVDKDSPIPSYFQIETDLKKRIMHKEWQIGDRLPGELDLSEQYDVSRITLRQALAELEKDGIISKKRGKGSFLAADPAPYVNTLNYSVVSNGPSLHQSGGPGITAQILEQRLVTELFPAVSENLALTTDSWAVYVKRLYLADGKPIAISRSHLPASLVPGLEHITLIDGSLLETVEQIYGLTADRVEDCIEAVRSTPCDCELLHCLQDTPLVLLRGISYLKNGQALEYSNTLWSGDSVRFQLTLKNGLEGFCIQESR